MFKYRVKNEKYTLNDVINQNYNNLDNISNNVLLNNMIELCTIKQNDIKSATVLKFIEKALQNIDDVEYITSIDQLLGKFERMYFSENKKELNEILYNCYHITNFLLLKFSILSIKFVIISQVLEAVLSIILLGQEIDVSPNSW